MSAIPLQQQDPTLGIVVDLTRAAAAGDTVQQDGNVVLHVKNASGAPINVTVPSHAHPTAGETTADLVLAVAAGVTRHIGPFSASVFTDPATGLCAVNYSSTTTVSVAAVRNAPTQN